ncbi:MAG: transglycosylase SLT domain-containing protein [Bacteroidia bacterium]|nr:transglycosylase SLT domain-containing protein [Bacteroidia bacterium]
MKKSSPKAKSFDRKKQLEKYVLRPKSSFSFSKKWLLIAVGFVAFLISANFLHEVYLAYTLPEPEVVEELYLIEEASAYVENKELFEAGVKDVARKLDIAPEWLMAVMYMESRFNPAVENHRGSGAVGLIQFMVPTVREINMRMGKRLYMKDIQNMSAVEQLELVENYLETVRKRRGEFNSLTDLYLAVLYPKAIGRSLDYKLFSKPSRRYRQNSGLDMNKDGIVSVLDIDIRMKKMFPTAYEIQKIAIDNP